MFDPKELRRLAEAANKTNECAGRLWVYDVDRHTYSDGMTIETYSVNHCDANDPTDRRDTFDLWESLNEPTARYVAALHPSVLIALLDAYERMVDDLGRE